MLLMKKRFFPAIRCGEKTTTLRYWRWRHVGAGQVHTVPGLGKVRIDSAEAVRLAELTDSHAADDGFASLAELRAALEEMYTGTNLDDGEAERKLYLVHFTLLDGEHRGPASTACSP